MKLQDIDTATLRNGLKALDVARTGHKIEMFMYEPIEDAEAIKSTTATVEEIREELMCRGEVLAQQ